MKRKRRTSASRASRASQSHNFKAQPATVAHFTAVEEAFFNAGVANTEHEPPESFADLDEGYERRPGLLRRLFARRQAA